MSSTATAPMPDAEYRAAPSNGPPIRSPCRTVWTALFAPGSRSPGTRSLTRAVTEPNTHT
jgi:hypothetical protein